MINTIYIKSGVEMSKSIPYTQMLKSNYYFKERLTLYNKLYKITKLNIRIIKTIK